MCRRIEEKHLLHHYLRKGIQGGEPHVGELLGRRSARRGVVMKHLYDIAVAGHDPGMQERIPMHWIFASKPMEEWIRVGENLRVEQVVEAQARVCLGSGGHGLNVCGHGKTHWAAEAAVPLRRR